MDSDALATLIAAEIMDLVEHDRCLVKDRIKTRILGVLASRPRAAPVVPSSARQATGSEIDKIYHELIANMQRTVPSAQNIGLGTAVDRNVFGGDMTNQERRMRKEALAAAVAERERRIQAGAYLTDADAMFPSTWGNRSDGNPVLKGWTAG